MKYLIIMKLRIIKSKNKMKICENNPSKFFYKRTVANINIREVYQLTLQGIPTTVKNIRKDYFRFVFNLRSWGFFCFFFQNCLHYCNYFLVFLLLSLLALSFFHLMSINSRS